MTKARTLGVMIAALTTLLVGILDLTIVSTSAIHIARSLAPAGGVADVPWLLAGYALASAAVQPLYGKLADAFGVKAVYLSHRGRLRGRLGAVRNGAEHARAHRLPHPAGARRGRADERHHGRHRPPFGRPGRPRRGRRHRRQRHRGGPAGARPGRRPAARRPGHRRRGLALDLLHQRAGRRGRVHGHGAVPAAAPAGQAGQPRAAERRPAGGGGGGPARGLPVGRPSVPLGVGPGPRVRGALPGGDGGVLLAAGTRPRAVLPDPAAAPPDPQGRHPAAAHDRAGDGRGHHLPDPRPPARARLDRHRRPACSCSRSRPGSASGRCSAGGSPGPAAR